jgi:hypothetical protein
MKVSIIANSPSFLKTTAKVNIKAVSISNKRKRKATI